MVETVLIFLSHNNTERRFSMKNMKLYMVCILIMAGCIISGCTASSTTQKETKALNQNTFENTTDNCETDNTKTNSSFVTYTINLLNSMGNHTNEDNWQMNLEYLKTHYEEISNMDNVNMQLVDWYIMEYQGELDFQYMHYVNSLLENMGVDTTNNDYVLNYLKTHYEEISDMDNVNLDYVNQCIERLESGTDN